VLVAGPRQFTDYSLLHAALDAVLVNRMPDVKLLTAVAGALPDKREWPGETVARKFVIPAFVCAAQ
jgi:hypothetical protein